ncbi:MAG: hypothetical protein M3N98_13265 [Actinomycetota bacterium]|nr:hypothetical protein [Actinomycetota bacterium]
MTIHRNADDPDGAELAAIDDALPAPDPSIDVHTDLAAAIGRLDSIPPHGGQPVTKPDTRPAAVDDAPTIVAEPPQANTAGRMPRPPIPRNSAVVALLTEMGALRRQLKETGALWAAQRTGGAGQGPEGGPDSASEVPEQLRLLSGDLAGGFDALLGELTVLGQRVDHAIHIWAGDASPVRALVSEINELSKRLAQSNAMWTAGDLSPFGPLVAELAGLRQRVEQANGMWLSDETSPLTPLVVEITVLREQVEHADGPLRAEVSALSQRVEDATQSLASGGDVTRPLESATAQVLTELDALPVRTASALGALLAELSEVGRDLEQLNGPSPSTEALPLSGVVAELAALRDRLDRVSEGVRAAFVEHHGQIVDEVRVVVEAQHRQIVGEVREMFAQQLQQFDLRSERDVQALRDDAWGVVLGPADP